MFCVRLCAITVSALLSSVSPCAAQGNATIATFEAINQRVPPPAPHVVHDLVLQTIRDELGKRGDICVPSDVAVRPLRPATADRVLLQAIDEGILANAFTATAIQQGCGDEAPPVQLNIFVLPSGEMNVRLVGLGNTFAWFSLIRDAQEPVMMAAYLKLSGVAPGCADPLRMDRFELDDTHQAGPEVFGVRYEGAWSERWHYTSCQQALVVPITFKADGKGGARISVNVKDVAAPTDD